MLVQFEGNTLSIVWRYEFPNGVRKTTCIIKNGIGKEAPRLAEASASCNVKDTDCKKCARKVTLNKVLNVAGFNKEQKRLFWNSYKAMSISDKNPEGRW
jgi:hypothetical protein